MRTTYIPKTGLIGKLNINDSVEGEAIETKIQRIVTNNEPITDGAPILYTDRKDGILPGYDIRTDRFDIAIEATDKITKSHQAKRMAKYQEKTSGEAGGEAGGE